MTSGPPWKGFSNSSSDVALGTRQPMQPVGGARAPCSRGTGRLSCPSMEIRSYDPGDLQACRDLWVELTVHHRRIYQQDSIGGDDPGAQFDEHLAAVGPDRIWLAVEEGLVLGATGLIIDGKAGEVEPLIVRETARGRGIGTALIEHAIQQARELGVTLLSVRPVARNTEAVRFFRDSGFEVLGHIEAFMDLSGDREWVSGERIAERDFLI